MRLSHSRLAAAAGPTNVCRFLSGNFSKPCFLLLAICWLLAAQGLHAQTWYVNAAAAPGGNGTTWASAFKDVQPAINAASSGHQIWVAAGTYIPTAYPTGCSGCSTNRDKAFHLKDGVKMYGGFPNTGNPGMGDRDPDANPTILSGDFKGDDVGFTNNSENAYHVVFSVLDGNTTELDGFTIRGGNANGAAGSTISFEGRIFGRQSGGGMLNAHDAMTTIRACKFLENRAISGAGMLNSVNSSPTVSGCVFFNNRTGSALLNFNGSSPTIVNCAFWGNEASLGAAAYNNINSNALYVNCSFSGNDPEAMHNANSSPTLKNCILWGNSSEIITTTGTPTVTYSIVQGGYAGTGNLDVDPLFVLQPNPANAPTATGDLHLQSTSPGINTGTATGAPATDFDGDARPQGSGYDMGYDEVLPTCPVPGTIWYVNATAASGGNGASWECAFSDLQLALAAASSGHQIWVAAGTYKPTSGTDRTISFVMKNGVEILGGFPNTGDPGLGDRDWVANVTTLSGNIGNQGVSTDNSYHVVFNNGNSLTNSAVMDGFSIFAGNASEATGPNSAGGGMYNDGSSPTVRNCVFAGNSALDGAGMYNGNCSPTVSRCVFSNNTGTSFSGGMSNGNASPTVSNCLFSNNMGGNNAAAMHNFLSTAPTITNCTFTGNAGAIYNIFSGCNPVIKNCIFWGNGTAITNQISATATVTYSDVQGGYTGTGNINADPLFISSTDFHLQNTSPCINTGTPTGAPADDFDGDARPQSGGFDMGYDEVLSTCPAPGTIWHVNAAAAPGGTGSSWDCAFQDLQLALAAAVSGDQIWVAEGTYKPTSSTDRSISFNMKEGVEILGGFPKTGDPGLGNRDWATNVTVLSGEIGAAGLTDNSEAIIVNTNISSIAVLDGFQIAFGYSVSPGPQIFNTGPGLFNIGNSSPTIRNCTFMSNTGDFGGTVLNINNCFPTFTNCVFLGNRANYWGAACLSYETSVATFVNCSFSGNAGNPGVIYSNGLPAVLKNCIIWGNGTQAIAGQATITNSIIEGGHAGTGNLNVDPKFVSQPPVGLGTAGDLHLQICSPAIDAANDADAPANDLDGNARFDALTGGNIADMGAYEFQDEATPTVAVCQASVDAILDNTGQATVLATALNNGSTGCSPLVFSINGQSSVSFDCSQIGSQSVTLTTTYINRTSTCNTTVNVLDNTPPTITCPANIAKTTDAGQCTAVTTYTVTASDNCAYTLTRTSPAGTASGSSFPAGITNVAWSVTDAGGNATSCAFTVTVTDGQAPTITCPANVTVPAGATCTATLASYTAAATANDNCTANPSKTQSPVSGTTITGSQVVTLTATDAANNSAVCTFTVTVVDQTAPSITCPANATVPAGATCAATLASYSAAATANDNCTANPSKTQSPVAGTTITGSQVVTLTATDGANNSAVCTFTVTVVDQTAPSITCPVNTTVQASANCTATLASYTAAATANDNCTANPSKTQSPVAGTTITGSQVVTLTATDAANNSTACTFTVTVADQTVPTITCPANATVPAGASCTAILSSYTAAATANDNCTANPTKTQSPISGTTIAGSQVVTLTATDAANNSTACTFTVTVADQTVPSITCPANATVPAGANCTATLSSYTSAATANDNCTVSPNKTQSPISGTTIAGNQVVTLTATDAANNSTACTFTVTVADQTVPTITCPANATVPAGASCTAILSSYTAAANAGDNCTASPTKTQSPISGTTIAGSQVVTLTATDAANNSAACTFTVTVVDQTVPSITCPANATVPAGASCTAILSSYTSAATANDNCTVSPNKTQSPISGTTIAGSQVVTLTATDAANNSTACTFTVTVADQTVPSITCPANATVPAGASCTAILSSYTAAANANDNCTANPTKTQSPISGTTIAGSQVVTLTATDAANNSAACTFTVTVVDQTAPGITCPANIAKNTDAGQCGAVTNYTVTASDNCSYTLTQTGGLASGSSFPVGMTTVAWQATDPSSNSTACSFTVTVTDAQAPSITCPANIAKTTDAGQCTAVTNYTVTASDNCSYTLTRTSPAGTASGSGFPVGMTTVAWQATDPSSNSTACSFTVTVTDAQAPSITCPANIAKTTDAGQCTAVTNYTVTASDNCSYTLTRTSPAGTASGSGFPVGMTTVAWQATDPSSNSTACSFTVTVTDAQAPSITCPANIAKTTDAGQCTAVTNYTVTASDNCSYTLTRTNGLASNSAFPTGTNVVNWSVTDAGGNSTICSFTVTVTDGQNPSIVCPANLVKTADVGQCSAVVTYASPTFSDNCAGVYLTRTSGPASGSQFPTGTTNVAWKATDAAGNSSVCNFTVSVTDGQAPSITCPANIVKNADAGLCTAVVTYTNPTYSDNCTGATATLFSGLTSGSTFPKGANSVVWQATDGAGLTKRCTFTVTVNDAEVPTIACPSNQVKAADAGICTAVVNYTTPTFTDNCAGAGVAIQSGLVSGSAFPKGITTVVWKATDAAGLTKTCSFKVTVNDTQVPVFTLCPSNQSVNTDAGLCTAVVNYATPTASDNCTPPPTVVKQSGLASGSNFPKGSSTVVWRATDGAGLTKTCSFTITVTDAQLPTITCPGNIAVTGSGPSCNAVVTYPNPTATDNCAITSNYLLSGLGSGAQFSQGVTTNIWKATDNSGLTQTCAFTVTVSCGATSEQGAVSREELAGSSEYQLLTMNLAPNPATTEVQIYIEGLGENGGEITMLDAQGRVVWQQTSVQGPTSSMDVSSLPSGLYQVRLRTEQGVVTKGLVVSRL